MACADSCPLFAPLTGRLTFSALWRKVMVGEPNQSDMVNIIKGCYPSLEPISSKLIGDETYLYLFLPSVTSR